MGLADALAAMLTNEDDLALLRRDPTALRDRFALTENELAMLAGAGPAGYRVTRRNVQAKLRRAIGGCLPVTVAHLHRHHPDLWERFASGLVRPPQPVHRHGIWESERLTDWLTARDLAPVADYARYELERAKLRRADHDRTGRDPADVLGPGTGTGTDRPLTLSSDVRILMFDHDVTAGPPLADLPVRRTHVVLHRPSPSSHLQTYRVSPGTALLLAGCDGTRTTQQLVACAASDPAAVRTALDRLMAADLVRPA
ncbi:hypothetical protein [Actinomadura oligospora]|uniref:hypothetical protein n=1 Tax=Actinomadura oligospora TaxID=111804 RepID=UPI00047D2FD6|nr:hypothetical protein [Actinomadura oligospora]